MTNNKQQGFFVSDYIYFENKYGSENARKFKKKMQKHKLLHYFTIVKYSNLEEEFCTLLKKVLINKKQSKSKNSIGILIDTNVTLCDVTIIPPLPPYYDILFLESEILNYKDIVYNTPSESIYWSKTSVKNSGNFIINGAYIDKILNLLDNKIQSTLSFFNKINNINKEHEPLFIKEINSLRTKCNDEITKHRQNEKDKINLQINELEQFEVHDRNQFTSVETVMVNCSHNKDKTFKDISELEEYYKNEKYKLQSIMEDVDNLETDQIKEIKKNYENKMNEVNNASKVIFTWSTTDPSFSEKTEMHVPNFFIHRNETKQRLDFITSERLDKEFKSKQNALKKLYYDKIQNIDTTPLPPLNFNISKLNSHNLPCVSLILPYTTQDNLYHAIITFLKLDYPSYKLELIIVDDTDSEKKYKHMVPNDARIRIVNIKNKNNPDESLPVGYKLNAGVKYASNDIIMHFFDTSNYSLNLKETIIHFLISDKLCLMSNKTGIFPNKEENVPDLANMIYFKYFWKATLWEDQESLEIALLYKFIAHRLNCIGYIPFVKMSFSIKPRYDLEYNCKELPFKLDLIVDPKLKESFKFLNC